MLNISNLSQYLHQLADEKQNHITNIFLANSQNEILISLKNKTNEFSVLGTLLNDSLYILKFNFLQQHEQQPTSTISEPIEIILQTQEDEVIFLFNIQNHFIYGVVVRREMMERCRSVVRESYQVMREELVKSINWMEIEKDNY